jgi:hypothetical protein
MARELSLDVEMNSSEADAAIARLALGFQKAGDSAIVAAEKAEKFEKAYKQGQARKQATKELDDLQGASTRTAAATDKLTAAVMRYAGPAVIVEAARRTIAWADNIEEMATRTKLSVEQVQQLTKVAEKNGSTFGAMAGLIQNVEQRLASHNKQAEATVKLLGLTPEALLKMDPLERLRAIAKGLADLKDPAQKSAAELALFGRAGDQASVALDAIAKGADKLESALGADFIRAGAQAQDVLDNLKNSAMDVVRAFFLLPMVATNKIGEWARNTSAGQFFEAAGIGTQTPMPGLPSVANPFAASAPGAPGLPAGYQVIGGPGLVTGSGIVLPGTGGTRSGSGGARVQPFRQSTFALGSTAAAIFALANTPGTFSAGKPNFFSSFNPVDAAFQSFQGVGFAPTVGMNAPGAAGGGGFLSRLFGGGRLTNIAAGGLGLLQNLIPGMSRTGQSIGALAGSFLGPLGAAGGGLLGGLFGKLFGGNQDKKAISAAKGSDDFMAMQQAAEKLGISLDKVFSAKKVKDFEKAVADVNKQIAEQEQAHTRVLSLMEKYGLTLADMGDKFKQTEMNKTALELATDFTDLVAAGADVNKVLEKMGPHVGAFVQTSIEMGTQVPREMEPIIKKMIEMGMLVDKNGDKFTDLAQIPWAQTMTQGFDKVEAAINRLADAILGVGHAFDRSADAARDFGDAAARAGDGYWNGGVDGASGMDSGGVAGRDFRRPSHRDVFPTLLRRGERVLPPGATGSGVSLSIGNLSVGGGYGSRADAVEDIGDAVVAYLERRGARLVA